MLNTETGVTRLKTKWDPDTRWDFVTAVMGAQAAYRLPVNGEPPMIELERARSVLAGEVKTILASVPKEIAIRAMSEMVKAKQEEVRAGMGFTTSGRVIEAYDNRGPGFPVKRRYLEITPQGLVVFYGKNGHITVVHQKTPEQEGWGISNFVIAPGAANVDVYPAWAFTEMKQYFAGATTRVRAQKNTPRNLSPAEKRAQLRGVLGGYYSVRCVTDGSNPTLTFFQLPNPDSPLNTEVGSPKIEPVLIITIRG